MKSGLSHLDESGRARMVDVGDKPETRRTARAQAVVRVGEAVIGMLRRTGAVKKGDVLETARIAGIQGAKRVPEIVPLAHPIVIDWIDVEAELTHDSVVLSTCVACTGRTGVEVEAMTAAATAALTVFDMCKAAGKGIEIASVRLLEKTGGKSGDWQREE